MGFRTFAIFENGKFINKNHRFSRIPDGATYRIRRSYHEISTSGWADHIVDKQLIAAFEKAGLDANLVNYVGTADGKYEWVKGEDDAPFVITHQTGAMATLNPKRELVNEFNLIAKAKELGINLAGAESLHGDSFSQVATSLPEKLKPTPQ